MRVTLINYFKDAERLTAITAKSTQSLYTPTDLFDILSEEEVKELEEEMLKYAVEHKLSSVLDFPYYIVEIKDVSRSFTHQWVRHRLAAHMQQSLRYVKVLDDKAIEIEKYGKDILVSFPPWFVIPPSVLMSKPEAIVKFVKSMYISGKTYVELLKEEIKEERFKKWFLVRNKDYIPKEDARFVLPIGTKTFISSAMDAEELLHIIKVRTCMDAQWEIRTAAWTLALLAYITHPRIFYRFGPWCIQERCRGFFIYRDKNCAKNIYNLKEELKEAGDLLRKEFENEREGEINTKYGKIKYYVEKFKEKYFVIDLTEIFGYIPPEEKRIKVIELLEKEGLKLDERLLEFKVIGRIRYI